jgi:small GTP-binding protein
MDFSDKDRPPRLKIVLVGEAGSGKTSLINRYAKDSFNTDVEPTVSVWTRLIKFDQHNRIFDLVVWDTAGQERYRSLTALYCRYAVVAIIVFDVTNLESFNQAEGWIDCVRSEVEEIVVALCGNKVDLADARVVAETTAKGFAEKVEAVYCETSAKTGAGVKELFEAVVTAVLQMKPELVAAPVKPSVELHRAETKSCC